MEINTKATALDKAIGGLTPQSERTLTPVIQMDSNKNVIAVFESVQHASDKTFISRNMIYESIRRKRGIMQKQYYFKYFE
jgi:hypothetical protein